MTDRATEPADGESDDTTRSADAAGYADTDESADAGSAGAAESAESTDATGTVDADVADAGSVVDGPVSVSDAASAGAGSVRVVGTAHVSAESAAEVERVIEEYGPDTVAVELDEGRYRQLKGETPDDLEASDLLRGNTVFQFLAYWLLSYVQARLGDEFDVTPGADMMAAVEKSEDRGLGVALVDRDIQVTIQRFWARMTGGEKLTMLASLPLAFVPPVALGLALGLSTGLLGALVAEGLAGPFLFSPGPLISGLALPLGGVLLGIADWLLVGTLAGLALGAVVGALLSLSLEDPEEGEEFDVEDLTDTDLVTAMLEEFRQFSPGGAAALIDERDAFIAHRLVALREQGHRVVAVVGAGHQRGIERYLDAPETLPDVASLTGRKTGRRFSVYKLVGYAFTLGFLAFFVLLAMAGVRNGFLLRLFGAWFLINGVFAFVLAKVGGAHWTSAGVGGAVAWLTSVNPLLAPGWFAGYVELRYVDVNVADIKTLNEILADEENPLGELWDRLRAVPLFRLITVVALTNVGSIVASVLFAAVVLPVLAADVGGVGEVADLMVEGARNSADLLWGALT
jgi:pheromone shutdown protein TraB